MSSERAFLIAPVETILFAEPTVASRQIADSDARDVSQLMLDAYGTSLGIELTLDTAQAEVLSLLAGNTGVPRRDAWLGIWEVYGPPTSAILCTTWRGMPYIAHVMTAPAARERGYASSLVREAAQVFAASGETHIGAMVDEGSEAMPLFIELGFTRMFTPAGL